MDFMSHIRDTQFGGIHTKMPAPSRRHIPQPYWGYEDIGIFLLLVTFIAGSLRLALRLRLLSELWLTRPPIGFQVLLVLFLNFSLYSLLKLRYHRPVLKPLGWVWPPLRYFMLAPALGSIFAVAVAVSVQLRHQVTAPVSIADVFVLSLVLGPILEESLFRGCLLPVLERSGGKLVAVVVTALLFALFHGPVNAAHWFWLTATGIAYGWMRIASESTSAPALLHASYNLALILISH
jgi:membrane protease YdiL (CAAX protease family)